LRRPQVNALELILGRDDPLLELGDLALRLALVLEHVAAKILSAFILVDIHFGCVGRGGFHCGPWEC
jgi:hypothetical protein